MKAEYIILAAGALLMGYIVTFKSRLIRAVTEFLVAHEGFSAHPYWDVSRYSWGYGTAAPGANGTITREQAAVKMVEHLMNDYEQLKLAVTRNLTVNQWVALLDFSYNLGVGNALEIVPSINTSSPDLQTKWMQYVHAGGVVNQILVNRRGDELDLWFS